MSWLSSNIVIEPTPAPRSIKPSGRRVQLWNDEHFSKLRQDHGVADSFINDGWDLTSLEEGGGKGGTLMAFIDSRWIIKELSKGDHTTLLKIGQSYVEHATSPLGTLLSPIYLHFHDVDSGRNFFSMKNQVGNGPFDALYDLKGCADDKALQINKRKIKTVHKRFYNLHLWCGTCCWSEARKLYFNEKQAARKVRIGLPSSAREKIMKQLEADTQWLADNELMDYSLLIARKSGEQDSCDDVYDDDAFRNPLKVRPVDGKDVTLFIGIIDFLQEWNAMKNVARGIKCLEFDKATIPPRAYGSRFYKVFSDRLELANERPSAAKGNKGGVFKSPWRQKESKQGNGCSIQ